jgi:multiple sugar transport system ATP-binding protein
MARVILKNIIKQFGSVKVLKNINLTIEDREFCVLLGPSGCGKTTLLRIIAGLDEPTEGEILIGDKDVTDLEPKDRDIAMVFQNYALYPHMSVYDNISFGLKIRGYLKDEIDSRVNQAAEILSIQQFLSRLPKALSGGQRQRVAVGRAIVRKPKVFLFDEPLSNLDAKLRVEMRAELKRLHQRLQATIVYVTHDQVEAMTLADKIVVMKDGVIQQIGSPLEIYNKPVNKFVAGFIGSPPMNFINGMIVKKDDKIIFDEGNFELKLPEEYFEDLANYINKEVLLGIRPEDVYDKIYVSSTAENTIVATVNIVELLGNVKHLHLTTGKNNFVCIVKSSNEAEEGHTIEVVFDISKIHIFDKETEQAII